MRIPITFIAILALSRAAVGGPRLVLPDDPSGTDVRAVAGEFYRRASKGDSAGAKSLFNGPTDDSNLLDSELEFVEAANRLQEQWIARFGRSDFSHKLSGSAQFLTLADPNAIGFILAGDDASTVSAAVPPAGLELHRFAGKWRVTHLTTRRVILEPTVRFYQSWTSAANGLRVDLAAGKFASWQEAAAAFDKLTGPVLEKWSDSQELLTSVSAPARIPTTQPVPTVDAARALLGEPFASRPVAKFLSDLPGLPCIVIYHQMGFVQGYEAGISISFGIPSGKISAIHFYSQQGDFSPYPGRLPDDLKFGKTRRDVEDSLGAPDRFIGAGGSPLVTIYTQQGFNIAYANASPKDPANPLVRVAILPASFAPPNVARTTAVDSPHLAFRLCVPSDDPQAAKAEQFDDPNDFTHHLKIHVERQVILDEQDVIGVGGVPPEGKDGTWSISLTLSESGGRRLKDVTKKNTRRRLAIIWDGQVLMAPVIQDPIGERVLITMNLATADREVGILIDQMRFAAYALPQKVKK